MLVRRASRADLPALRDVIFEAMSLDPEWMSLFPIGASKDAEYVKFVEKTLEPALDPTSRDSFVTVIELESVCPQSPGLIVAVAVWDMFLPAAGQGLVPTHKGGKGVLEALVNAFAQGQQRYFGSYNHHMHLRILATRPHYQQQGCAKALCQWGVDAAMSWGMGVAVLTGPRGYILFSDLGFVDLGPFPVRVDGGREETVVKAMVLSPEGEARRGSLLGHFFGHVSR